MYRILFSFFNIYLSAELNMNIHCKTTNRNYIKPTEPLRSVSSTSKFDVSLGLLTSGI